METENALTNAKESPNELFFEEEARLWAEVYGKQSDKPDLESLQRMLENMNHLLLSLELHPDENTNNRKTYQLSAQLMDAVVFLSKNTSFIHSVHLFCNVQIAAFKKLQDKEAEVNSI